MLTLFFHDGPVLNYEHAKQSDTKLFARFFWEMLARGVYLPCSQFEAAFVSAAHYRGGYRPHDHGSQPSAGCHRSIARFACVTRTALKKSRRDRGPVTTW